MPSNTHNLERCASYEDAVKLFNTPPLRSTTWAPNERPLGSSQQHHYRVQKMLDGSFRVWLYSTCMAQYFKPEGNERRETYSWDRRVTSTSFMWHVVHMGKTENYGTTDGRRVQVPMTAGGVVLYLVDDKLDLTRSSHPCEMRRIKSDEDKARLKEFKARMKIYVTLAVVRYIDILTPGAREDYRGKHTYGAFSSPAMGREQRDCKDWLQGGGAPGAAELEAFMSCAEAIVAYGKGRAEFNDNPAPTLKSLEAAIMRWAVKMANADRKSTTEQMPCFPEVK